MTDYAMVMSHPHHWLWCNTNSTILNDSNLSAPICYGTASDHDPCVAICPNPDISGIGVRSSFYIQSFLNTLLVIFSPSDSVPTTWAATLMTSALVIAAMVQKYKQTITLHHAILTLNFATLSCISSLAVAPTLSIWRLTPGEYYAKQLARDLLDEDESHRKHLISDAVNSMTEPHRKKIKRAQSRQRLFLAIALLLQVALQWAWGVVLFVSPTYSQTNCTADTKLIFFLNEFTALDINDHFMVIWVLWLLTSLGITMFMTIVLALTSPSRARPFSIPSSPPSIGTGSSRASMHSASRPIRPTLSLSAFAAMVRSWQGHSTQHIFWYNMLYVILWLIYIISRELQIRSNCLFTGENDPKGFGQITALLLALAPLWSLIVAVSKWSRTRRKLVRRRHHEEAREGSPDTDISDRHSTQPSSSIYAVALHAYDGPAAARSRGRATHAAAVWRSPSLTEIDIQAQVPHEPNSMLEEGFELTTFLRESP